MPINVYTPLKQGFNALSNLQQTFVWVKGQPTFNATTGAYTGTEATLTLKGYVASAGAKDLETAGVVDANKKFLVMTESLLGEEPILGHKIRYKGKELEVVKAYSDVAQVTTTIYTK